MSSENSNSSEGLYPNLSQDGPVQSIQREPTPPPPFNCEPAPLPEPRVIRQHSFVSERRDIEKAASDHCISPSNNDRGTCCPRFNSLLKIIIYVTLGFIVGTAISEYRHMSDKVEEPTPLIDPATVDLSKWFPRRKTSS